MRVYYNRQEMKVLNRGWDERLKEDRKKLILGNGSNKTFHLVMGTEDNDEADDRKVAAKRKNGDSSGDEDRNSDVGYNSDRGVRVRGTWKDIKSGKHGQRPGSRLFADNSNEETHDGVEKDKESEGVRKETEYEGGRRKRANESGIKQSKSKKNK
jgi:hypothetical protein